MIQDKVRKVNLWYKYKVAAWQKAVTLIGAVVLAVALAEPGGYSAPLGALIVTSAMMIIHLGVTNYGLLPALAVWAANLAAIPTISLLILAYAPPEIHEFILFVTTASFILSSVLWTFLAYRYSSGKLWVTLAIIFTIQAILAVSLSTFVGLWQWVAPITLMSGGIGFVTRYYSARWWKKTRVSRRNQEEEKTSFQTLPFMKDKKRDAVIKQLRGSTGITFISEGDKEVPTVIATKRGIISLFFYGTEEAHVDFEGKNAPSYKKNPLSPFTALLLKNTARYVKGAKKPYTVLVLDDHGIKRNAIKVDVLSLENVMQGSVIVTNPLTISRTLNQLPVVAFTEQEVDKVIKHVQGDN